MMRFRYCSLLIVLAALVLNLAGCGNSTKPAELPQSNTEPATIATEAATEPNPAEAIEELTITVTEADIYQLEQYPNLKRADLTGSTCYSAIAAFQKKHPEIEITYAVYIGDTAVEPGAESTALAPGTNDLASILDNLPYLPKLTTLSLPKTELSTEDLKILTEAYPDISVTYSIAALDQEWAGDTKELNLSFLTPEQIPEAAEGIRRLPGLETVELMDNGISRLGMADVKTLVDAAPKANFHYEFSLFGRTVSTTEEIITFQNLNLRSEDEPTLRSALAIMTGCRELILDKCGMSNELLAEIREDYPRTELVWRIYFGKYTTLTNDDTIRAVYGVDDSNCEALKYCRNVKYMDIGHNEDLSDLSFVAYMPNLEILIASGCKAADLSGFENCTKLEFLELAYCGFIKDITPLSGCVGLKNLNISHTKVSSLLPLDGLPLERLIAKQSQVPAKEQKVFQEIHPDCIVRFTGKDPYAGSGWRYIDEGKTYTEIYKKVREVFGYDDLPT